MSRFIGGRGGDVVPINSGTDLSTCSLYFTRTILCFAVKFITAQEGLTATGGVISDYNDGGTLYRSHIFTSSGEFTVTDTGSFGTTVEFLLVAGGGAGGDNINGAHGGNGGGGGGGLVEGNALPVAAPSTFTITIGAGGAVPP